MFVNVGRGDNVDEASLISTFLKFCPISFIIYLFICLFFHFTKSDDFILTLISMSCEFY